MAALGLLPAPARTGVVPSRHGRLSDRLLMVVKVVTCWSSTGQPVRMDVSRRRSDLLDIRLMPFEAVGLRLNQFLQPLPALFRSIQLDDLEPVRMSVLQGLPAG